jgi:hypothetical protein
MNWSKEHKIMMARRLQLENRVPVQVVDFSPLTYIFRIISRYFTPFLSCKGLVFRRLRIYGALVESRQAEPRIKALAPGVRLHSIAVCGNKRSQAAKFAGGVPLLPGWSRIYSRYPGSDFFWEEAGQASMSGDLSSVYRGGNSASTELNRDIPS